MDAYLGAHADLDGTDVERGTAAVGGHEALVELYHFLYHFGKDLFGTGSILMPMAD